MKKVFTFALIAVLVLGMAVPAVALGGNQAAWDRLLPALHENSFDLVIFYSMDDVLNLSEEDQKLMEEAQEKLDEAYKEHLALRYFCMAEIVGSKSVGVVFDPIAHAEIEFQQYVDGAWKMLEHTVNADGSISVEGIMNGPLAIFVNDHLEIVTPGGVIPGKLDSSGATPAILLPDVSETTTSMVLLHSTEMVPHLSDEIQDLMAEAKEKLKEACPVGCAVKFFCYVEIIGAEENGSVVFEEMDFEEIHFAQYVDGEWMELPFEINEDGTINVHDVQEGPKVIFIK